MKMLSWWLLISQWISALLLLQLQFQMFPTVIAITLSRCKQTGNSGAEQVVSSTANQKLRCFSAYQCLSLLELGHIYRLKSIRFVVVYTGMGRLHLGANISISMALISSQIFWWKSSRKSSSTPIPCNCNSDLKRQQSHSSPTVLTKVLGVNLTNILKIQASKNIVFGHC